MKRLTLALLVAALLAAVLFFLFLRHGRESTAANETSRSVSDTKDVPSVVSEAATLHSYQRAPGAQVKQGGSGVTRDDSPSNVGTDDDPLRPLSLSLEEVDGTTEDGESESYHSVVAEFESFDPDDVKVRVLLYITRPGPGEKEELLGKGEDERGPEGLYGKTSLSIDGLPLGTVIRTVFRVLDVQKNLRRQFERQVVVGS